MLCEDCGVELDKNEEDVCDRCDFMRNYPDMPEAKVDRILSKRRRK